MLVENKIQVIDKMINLFSSKGINKVWYNRSAIKELKHHFCGVILDIGSRYSTVYLIK